MRKTALSLSLLLALAGCRTPAYLGGEFRHRDPSLAATGPTETLAHRDRWIFFWGLLGTENIDVPEVGGGINLQNEIADKFGEDERLVDMTVEEGVTLPGVITAFFTIGIVTQKEVVVKARHAEVARRPATAPRNPPRD